VIFLPQTADAETRWGHWATLCARLGYQLPKRALLIGIRGLMLGASELHPVVSSPRYDDTFVLLWRDETGQPFVKEFAGATHAYQKLSKAAPDADHDGTPDVGTIRPGLYCMETLQLSPPKLWIKRTPTDPRVPTARDTDHDGVVSQAETDASIERTSGPQVDAKLGDYALEVLMHPGFTSMTEKGTPFSSIGCQTAHVDDVRTVAERGKLDYLLVDGARVIAADANALTDADRAQAAGLVASSTAEAAREWVEREEPTRLT
jgi:hypothetical protein